MVGCRYLTLKSDENDLDPDDPEVYWWCSKQEKYASHRSCTIIPCIGRALNGCENAEYPDYFKKRGYMMGSERPCPMEAEG